MAATIREDVATLGRDLDADELVRPDGGVHDRRPNQREIEMVRSIPGRGHATWPMPERRQGLYAAWKHAAGKDG